MQPGLQVFIAIDMIMSSGIESETRRLSEGSEICHDGLIAIFVSLQPPERLRWRDGGLAEICRFDGELMRIISRKDLRVGEIGY